MNSAPSKVAELWWLVAESNDFHSMAVFASIETHLTLSWGAGRLFQETSKLLASGVVVSCCFLGRIACALT